ncbi:hypothetical protein [Mesorhizobium sp. M0800]|uniref:hypothetical protein n=1 Tax=Mesorhizobium sp. M0800 TaxID=2957000 RepID=UPI00333AE292
MAVFTPIGKVQKGRLLASFGFFFILGACIATFSPSGEKLLRDVLMTTISPFVAPPTDIVIVTITEQTLDAGRGMVRRTKILQCTINAVTSVS